MKWLNYKISPVTSSLDVLQVIKESGIDFSNVGDNPNTKKPFYFRFKFMWQNGYWIMYLYKNMEAKN